ncbi:MAG TPA: GTP 3',8-cyclase MoaA [Parvularculaceae bacterium]|nr:GTP 3',8-cyclase MoaA [Parvularculaceae bacterium]HNS86289.1 GTP 3',8-cyclase MoaA [Parvularculaceae bacterium]
MSGDGAALTTERKPLIDSFGRRITYLRLSVTDRCDLRCNYCMAEDAVFAPKSSILTLEELEAVASAFIARGVRKIRLTGGEPLARRNIMHLVDALGRHLKNGDIDELAVTTNATQLARFAGPLRDAGVKRINVSLDTLNREKFAEIARRDALDRVLAGVEAALEAGLKIKINTVALKDRNIDEIPALIEWAHGKGMDLTLIEVMPLGDVEEDRIDQFAPLSAVKESLGARWTLENIPDRTGGPARYVRVKETGGRVGFITPLTGNFCNGCNRVRVTCSGELYMCLGQQRRVDLKAALREGGPAALTMALDEAMRLKPLGHDFEIARRGDGVSVPRYMSATGG